MGDWLDRPPTPADLLAPADEALLSALEIRPVGPAVGNVRNDGPELVARVAAAAARYAARGPVELTLF